MSDTLEAASFRHLKPSSLQASKVLASVKSRNTKCELVLRSVLWSAGFRFRKNYKAAPGKPDLVFLRKKVAVFCDGDFWHGRNWEDRQAKLAVGSNAGYWLNKILANKARDARINSQLKNMGWQVIRLWETDILADAAHSAEIVIEALSNSRRGQLTTPVDATAH